MVTFGVSKSEETLRAQGRRAVLPAAILLTVGTFSISSTSPAHAQIDGLSYSLSPTVEWFRWDSELGLEDAPLYGARLGLNFGQAMSLEGFYLRNDEVRTELDASFFPTIGDARFRNQDLALERYGADLVLNLTHARAVPFLLLGGGIQEFDPDLGPSFTEIELRYGGGLRFAFSPRMQGRIALQNSRFRTDRFQMAPLPEGEIPDDVPVDPGRDDFRNHLALAAGIDILLGGYEGRGESEVDRALRARYQAGIRGAAWPIEPFVGSLRYGDDAGLRDQDMLGIRSGIDFGSYLGLRGFYARGMDDEFSDTDPFQTYGAELQFLLSPGPGVRPYLIGGVGYLDYLDSFRDAEGLEVDDETALLAGGGLRFDLGRHLHMDLSARDYIITSRAEFEDVRDEDDLSNNWLYSAGLTFQIGGGGSGGVGRGDDVPVPIGAKAVDSSGQLDLATAAESRPAEADSMDAQARMTASPPAEGWTKAGRTPGRMDARGPGRVHTDSTSMDYHSGHTVLIPVPREGEIYVRYGSPGAVTIESWLGGSSDGGSPPMVPGLEERLRQLIREEIRSGGTAPASSNSPEREGEGPGEEPDATGAEAGGTTDARDAESLQEALVGLEERLARRMDERLEARLPLQSAEHWSQSATELSRDPGASPVVVGASDPGSGSGRSLRGITPYSGVSVNEPRQFALGVRADLGPIFANAPFDLMPEFSLSLAENSSWLLGLNARWLLLGRESTQRWKPYIHSGPALVGVDGEGSGYDRTGLVLNLGYGVEHDLGRFRVFAEHQGVDLFEYNRILVGVSGFER